MILRAERLAGNHSHTSFLKQHGCQIFCGSVVAQMSGHIREQVECPPGFDAFEQFIGILKRDIPLVLQVRPHSLHKRFPKIECCQGSLLHKGANVAGQVALEL